MTEAENIKRRIPWRGLNAKVNKRLDDFMEEALSAPWRFDTPVTSYILCDKHEYVIWLERPVYKSPLTGWKCGPCYGTAEKPYLRGR